MPSSLERKKNLLQQKQQEEKQRKQLVTAGIVAGALVAVGAVVWVSGILTPAAPKSAAQAPTGGCANVQSFPSQGQDHIAPAQPHAPYNSNPPNSGPHWDNPQQWGIYTIPQVQEQLIHNLEHGGIIVQYKNLSGDELQFLTTVVRRDSHHMILAPYPALPGDNKIALTAWTKLQYCSGVDENAIRAFVNAFRDKGPEMVP